MLTHLNHTLCSLFTVLMLLLSTQLLASDLTELIIKQPDTLIPLTNDNANSLPSQYATDSQGKVIIIPSEQRSALEYRADDIYLKPARKKPNTKQTNTRSSTTSRSSITIANDPSCRWLHSRLKHLTKKLRQTQSNQFSHYQDEIDLRKREWRCLKCASTGPTDVERNVCQSKR
ncbi:hypothetical protein [Shewanella livingstonensis]|uniref:Uncharacterized protein n=1 Tax=Shewanella livingstonensis TaxID=150120 RepID=A0A3G8LP13_9GAMM|nr:hypothetical protein [Shewanella livingstonensis]AZG71319.1 hypothetical protein EGC82_00180 [Shewanella livingstonensis]